MRVALRDGEVPPNETATFGIAAAAAPSHSEDVQRDHSRRIMRFSRQGLWRDAVSYLATIPHPNSFHFGAALTACEKAGEPAAALAVYESMKRSSVPADTVTHLPLMRCLLRSGEYKAVLALLVPHEAVCARFPPIRVGMGQPELSLGYSLAVKAAEKLGDWQLAISLYERALRVTPAPYRNTAASVFNACYAAKEWELAVQYMSAALPTVSEQRLHANGAVTANKAIAACAKAGAYERGLAVLAALPSNQRDGYTYTAALDLLKRRAQPGDAAAALKLLCEVARPGRPGALRGAVLRAPVNIVLLMLLRAGEFAAAKQVFLDAQGQWEVKPDRAIFGTMLVAAGTHDPAWAAPLLRDALADKCNPGETALTSTLFNLSKAGHWQECAAVLEAMEQGGATVTSKQYGALVAACDAAGESAMVLRSMSAMLAKGLAVDDACVAGMLSAAKELGLPAAFSEAVALLQQIESRGLRRGLSFDPWAGLVGMLAAEALVEEVVSAAAAMEECGAHAGEAVWDGVLVAAHRSQQAGGSDCPVAWLRKLERRQVPLGLAAYVTAISSCRAGGRSDEANQLWRSMRQAGIKPTTAAYNALMSVLCLPPVGPDASADTLSAATSRHGAEQALSLLSELQQEGLAPDAVTFATTLRALYGGRRHAQLLALWGDVPADLKAQPALAGRGLRRLLFRSCEQAKDGARAAALLAATLSRDAAEGAHAAAAPDATMFGGAIAACERAGAWREAVTLLDLMRGAARVRPTRKCWEAAARAAAAASGIGSGAAPDAEASAAFLRLCRQRFGGGGGAGGGGGSGVAAAAGEVGVEVGGGDHLSMQMTGSAAAAVVGTLAALGEWELTLAAFQHAPAKSQREPSMCGLAVLACWHRGAPCCDAAAAVLRAMHATRATPTVVSVSLAIDLLDRHGRHADAADVFGMWAHVWAPLARAPQPVSPSSLRLSSMTPAVALAAIRWTLGQLTLHCAAAAAAAGTAASAPESSAAMDTLKVAFEVDDSAKDRALHLLHSMGLSADVQPVGGFVNARVGWGAAGAAAAAAAAESPQQWLLTVSSAS